MASSGRLKPGEKGKIKATVALVGKSGPMVKSIQVQSNDPAKPVTSLTLRVNAKPAVPAGTSPSH